FLLLDPNLPKQRLDYYIHDAGIHTIISNAERSLDIHNMDVRIIEIDNSSSCQNIFEHHFKKNDLAYLLYTSGSTGLPKGSLIHHDALFNVIDWMITQLKLDVYCRAIALAPLTFDACLIELLTPLVCGGTVIMTSSDTLLDPWKISRCLENESINLMFATPSLWQMLMDSHWQGNTALIAISGGEILPYPLAMKLIERVGNLWNMYGPTETTILSTATQITRDTSSITVGKPIANTTCYILDENLEPISSSNQGELYIGGIGLASGYLNKPELTAKYFIKSPFADSKSSLIYKTGDLACYSEAGDIVILGRADAQVKLRGVRIELTEIEYQLCQCPGVRGAVVVVRTDQKANPYLAAYLIARSTKNEIKVYLEQFLPAHMIPSAFVFLSQFPQNYHFKLDRSALPMPLLSDFTDQTDFQEPKTDIERKIMSFWKSIFNLEKIGTKTNFFELGGHSLNAIQMIAQINDYYQITFPLHQFFLNPFIESLAKIVTEEMTHFKNHLQQDLTGYKHNNFVLLSHSQKRFWILEKLTERPGLYHVPCILIMRGYLSIKYLEKSFQYLIHRHHILRTRIVEKDGLLFQEVIPELAFAILSDDYESENQLLAEINKPFDLSVAPLMRVTLFKVNDTLNYLSMTIHHMISDAISLNILKQELSEYYNALTSNKHLTLPDLPVQYTDFTLWQHQLLDVDKKAHLMAWWKKQLENVPLCSSLPFDRPRKVLQSYHGYTYEFSLSKHIGEQLDLFARSHQLTPYVVMLSAFVVLLYRYSEQDDLVIGTPVVGRQHKNLERLIGCFINTLPLRVKLNSFHRLIDVIQYIKDSSVNVLLHQNVSYDELIKNIDIDRSTAHPPLFQVLFNYVSQDYTITLGDLSIDELKVERGLSEFDLSMTIIKKNENGYLAQIEYNTDLFDFNTICNFSRYYEKLLACFINEPHQSIHKVPLLSSSEIYKQVVEWNQSDIYASTSKT
ncbi:MAG: AMP-binding protein, partial [Legionella longbeachae]|nr:AMP-binding protein [Legionella longbeachae]